MDKSIKRRGLRSAFTPERAAKKVMLNRLQYTVEERKKGAFYCSDYGKLDIDLYFAFKGEKMTNPPQWNDTLKWGAGKGVEMSMLDILKDNGIVEKDYVQEEHGRVEMARNNIAITGYIDAIIKDNSKGLLAGCPLEIKSINNKNSMDIKKYADGYPRDNYVGQLACYMDFLGKDTGYLFVASIDGLSTFIFECKRLKDKFVCGSTEIDLYKEYERWGVLYNDYVLKDIPPPLDVRYKIPVEEVDWKTVSKGDISKARNNNKVIGDHDSWKIQYSSWKDKILEMQGVQAGYSDEELKIIRELTSGYTAWK